MTPADRETEYAYWTVPETSFTVTYSLPLFHEIDFQVNEGYRRIPHGGVETGGVLFGNITEQGVQIEAFRPIECEHASGPSFVLSERDLAKLKQLLAGAESDPELKGLQTVGWFIAHTRSPLRMNERESVLFRELFPGAGRLTLLIKPERFQPTRYGFLVRGEDGGVSEDATDQAIILPLPGRAGRGAEGPKPSIPAPTEQPEPVPPPKVTQEARQQTPAPPAVKESPKQIDPFQLEKTQEILPVTPRPPAPSPSPPAPSPKPAVKPEPETVTSPPPYSPAPVLPSADEIKQRRTAALASEEQLRAQPVLPRRQVASPNLRLTIVLLLAAALGCAVGYWAYLQLPSPTIELRVERQPYSLLISWPPEQTRDAVYAAIRVDDGPQVPLSFGEKISGQARVNLNGDNMKVELISQHWMRDSRGIIRYVKAQPPPAAQQPAATPPTTPPADEQRN